MNAKFYKGQMVNELYDEKERKPRFKKQDIKSYNDIKKSLSPDKNLIYQDMSTYNDKSVYRG